MDLKIYDRKGRINLSECEKRAGQRLGGSEKCGPFRPEADGPGDGGWSLWKEVSTL